jgi:hypothetical protein
LAGAEKGNGIDLFYRAGSDDMTTKIAIMVMIYKKDQQNVTMKIAKRLPDKQEEQESYKDFN